MARQQTLTPAACAEIIDGSPCTVTLSGAGISTAAGIPDFRGPRGLYVTRRYDPEKVFDIRWFRREPRRFYDFARDFVDLASTLRPTFTHFFLAQLEATGRLQGMITQNIDMLHQSAGNANVVELHGSYGSALCGACGRGYTGLDYPWWDAAMRAGPSPPVARCPACGGVLKPEIVFFGEQVREYEEAERMILESDLLLVIGSSLTVTPASFLPLAAGGTTIVVNRGPVTLPPSPQRYFVDSDIDEFFRQVAAALGISPSRVGDK